MIPTTLSAAKIHHMVCVLAMCGLLVHPAGCSTGAMAQDDVSATTAAASANDPSANDPSANDPPANDPPADDPQAGDPAGIAVTVMPSGVQRFASGGWASLAVVGVNPTDQDVEEVVSVFVGDDPNLQFSTRFWLPARSKRQSWLPVAIPPSGRIDGNRVDLSMIRIAESEGEESFTDNVNQMPVSVRSLMLVDNEINTGLFADPLDFEDSTERDAIRERLNTVLNAGRDAVTMSPSDLPIVSFLSNFMPPTYGALDELDQVVIAGDQLRYDSDGVLAIRRWIRRGGRAWIMLDATSRSLVDDLLGDDADFTVIDRSELNAFELQTIDPIKGTDGSTESWSSENPVTMLRVLTQSDDVVCRIDGWPVAFWKPVGDGEVLFTALGADGWIHSDRRVTAGLNQLAREFFEPKNQSQDLVAAMKPIVDDQIGYQIPRRSTAAIVLGINALVILIGGVWWARQRRLERMALLVPVSAIVTTVIMLAIGSSHATAIPSTVATSQVVQVRPATDEADVSTIRAVYSQQSGELGLISSHQVMTMPMENVGTSETRRVSLEDDGTSRWLGPGQPPGVVRHLGSDSAITLQQPIRLRGTFDGEGFRGTLRGIDPNTCQDGLIVASPAPMTAVTIDADAAGGQVIAPVSDRLPPGQFIPGSMLTDQQRTRRDFFDTVLSSADGHSLGQGPSLLVWTDPLDLGVQFADRFDHSGAALMSIPIQLERPAAGVEFRIPSSFIRTKAFWGPQGRTTLFNPRTGKWLPEMTKAAEARLLFQFPDAARPMTLQRVNVTMKINAPSRTFFVNALVDGQPTRVFQRDNATGVIEFAIESEDALRLHADGGLWLAFGVTESFEATEQRATRSGSGEAGDQVVDNATWQIDYVHLDAVAQINASDLPSLDEASDTGTP
ncbi:hypothetical protein Enr13x_35210 [Stieleria neptunia]|uniref:Transmembrane protein n=1 Tax=Stieleria neptunia TaxID=2527979 RepID=A0A518HS64_9BACT|nr:hypothetical protein [Stieleria neptunia]QDV43664.1 hypothetical protein Enr13x_35210 [Stieleria neptunia]